MGTAIFPRTPCNLATRCKEVGAVLPLGRTDKKPPLTPVTTRARTHTGDCMRAWRARNGERGGWWRRGGGGGVSLTSAPYPIGMGTPCDM